MSASATSKRNRRVIKQPSIIEYEEVITLTMPAAQAATLLDLLNRATGTPETRAAADDIAEALVAAGV